MAPERVVVIGAGPAGLMAADVTSAAGIRTAVYDRMPSPGRKLLMAGRGGLNLTHGEPPEVFLGRYGGGGRDAILPHLARFTPTNLRDWAGDLGESTFVGSSGRVFPDRWKASPLLRAWLRRLQARQVRFAMGHRWDGFAEGGSLRLHDGRRIVTVRPAATVLALGGASWPKLGSDGRWVEILESAGHPVSRLEPSNCAVELSWSPFFRERFAGTPLKRLAGTVGGASGRGEAVVTASGLEGGLIYALGAAIRAEIRATGVAILSVDLRPDLSVGALEDSLGRPRGTQSASTFLRKRAGLPPVSIGLLRESTGGGLPREPGRLAALVKSVPLRVQGLGGFARAISTAGGVPLSGLDEHLMFKDRPGVFVAGEMLDWDAPTGGYLLQACFATGAAAGEGARRWLERGPDRARDEGGPLGTVGLGRGGDQRSVGA